MKPITFFVHGVPRPGGSKKGFFNPKTKRVIIVDASNNKPWRESVRHAALATGSGMLSGPLSVTVTFYMPRPQSHFRTGKHAGELKADAPQYHDKMPDATKLWRSTEDALTGVLWKDDAQIAVQKVEKRYANDHPGASVTVEEVS